jgi:hypothetical protein
MRAVSGYGRLVSPSTTTTSFSRFHLLFAQHQMNLNSSQMFGLPDSFWTLEAGSPNKHQVSWYTFWTLEAGRSPSNIEKAEAGRNSRKFIFAATTEYCTRIIFFLFLHRNPSLTRCASCSQRRLRFGRASRSIQCSPSPGPASRSIQRSRGARPMLPRPPRVRLG